MLFNMDSNYKYMQEDHLKGKVSKCYQENKKIQLYISEVLCLWLRKKGQDLGTKLDAP